MTVSLLHYRFSNRVHVRACYLGSMCVLCAWSVRAMYVLCAWYVRAMCVLCACYVRAMCVLCACYLQAMCTLFACAVRVMCVLCACYTATPNSVTNKQILVRVTLGKLFLELMYHFHNLCTIYPPFGRFMYHSCCCYAAYE